MRFVDFGLDCSELKLDWHNDCEGRDTGFLGKWKKYETIAKLRVSGSKGEIDLEEANLQNVLCS